MRQVLFALLVINFFMACQNKDNDLEIALKLAGENRSELEFVLSHYTKNPADSLKLQAAEFLIKNMPGHYTLDSDLFNEVRQLTDKDTTISYFTKKALDIVLSRSSWLRAESLELEDIKHISSAFLIRHIDISFECLNKFTWLQKMPFEMFLEYVLPYRFENERIDLWREALMPNNEYLENIYLNENIKYMITSIEEKIVLPEEKEQLHFPEGIGYPTDKFYRNCYYLALKECFRLRSANLPSRLEFVPFFAARNGYHYWSSTVSPEFKKSIILELQGRRAAKIYCRTYSHNPVVKPMVGEYVPAFFLDPFNRDVSDEYMHTANIKIPVKNYRSSPRHGYLCVFNGLDWKPVAVGNVNKSNVYFEKIGKNIVYLPVYYKGQKNRLALNYPFSVDLQGEITYFIPDTCKRVHVSLARKYPSNGKLANYNRQLQQAVVFASNDSDFRKSEIVADSLICTDAIWARGHIKNGCKFRFWKLLFPKECEIAEISFIDRQGISISGKTENKYINAVDNDPLTNANIEVDGLLVDFGEPVELSEIICIPRGDGNGIYPNNEYELLYYDLSGWRSLGRKTAKGYSLDYANVPSGALLWLHNYTSGIEERIFTYENGEIRFW